MAVVAIIASLVPAVLATVALVVYLGRPEAQRVWQIIAGYGLLMIALAGMELAVLVPALNH
jgi:hypothetical protein